VRSMEWSEAQEDQFIVGHCIPCGRTVLTHAGYGEKGCDLRLCVHCDTGVDRDLRAVVRPELDSYGYAVIEDLGCGNPDCGGGRCLRS
jgi:hypothetical protein